MAEYSNFVCSNQILPQKVDCWGKKVAFYSIWRSNHEWPFICIDTVSTNYIKSSFRILRYRDPCSEHEKNLLLKLHKREF